MLVTFIIRLMFVVWAMAVAALSVISYPGSKDLLMSFKLTSSGFVVHGIAYFVGILLCYFSFNKKEDRDQRSEIRSQMSEDGRTEIRDQKSDIGGRKNRGRRSEVAFIWMSGLLIFLFSVVLEVVQFYLPYRTFNVYDVVANGIGIGTFCLISFVWTFYYKMNSHKK
ncbi:MAG TPA: VanZ family protein [Desulfobacterales bacterium]|nr:VanZ family protein [Desulfobacterales bacterium]